MCGIVGYIGKKDTLPILLDGLKQLDYRGYDSAGVCIITNDKVKIVNRSGKIKDLIFSVKDRGVLSGVDITMETALTKLMYLHGKGYAIEKIKSLLTTSMRGEISV